MSTEEIQNATPAVQEAAEQVQQVESNSSEATAEQTQEPQQEQAQEQKEETAKKEPWFQKRIGELTREKYEARRAAEDAQREAQQYREYLARQQQGQQAQQEQQQQPNPQVDVQTLAKQEAARMVAEQRLVEATNKVWAEGTKEFQNFDASVANLQMIGMDREFVELAVDSDAGHKVLHYLGQEQNLAEADRILRLPLAQKVRELAKLEYKLNQPPPPKPVSNAPAPIKPIGASANVDVDPTQLSDAEWYERVYLKRRQ